MNVENALNQLGIDAITGVNLMDWLGVSIDELHSPQRFGRLQSVIGYLKQFPEDAQRFIIQKSTRGKMVDKLDHVFEYTNLLKQKEGQMNELHAVEKEKIALTNADEQTIFDLTTRETLISDRLTRTNDEISIYE